MKNLLSVCLLAALFATLSSTRAAEPAAATPPPIRKAAIFVENRAGAALNDKVSVLEDFLSSRVTEKGFSIISRELAVAALKRTDLVLEQDRSRQTADGNKTTSESQKAKIYVTSGTTELDKKLSDNTTALRLAQNLGADYLLAASIATYGTEKKTFTDGALKTVNVIHTMRVSYKVLEASQGGSVIGDTVKASKAVRFTENSLTESSEVLNELLDDAANQVAENIGKKQASAALATLPVKPGTVEFGITCGMTDMTMQPINFPAVRVKADGTAVLERDKAEVQAVDVSVELDGVILGSAPGQFKAAPGLHKIRLTREGFKDWERTINIVEGQKLRVAMQMTEAGYARWKANSLFLYALEKDYSTFIYALEKDKKVTDATLDIAKKLTDGEVKVLEGKAQLLRQSGFKYDFKYDSKDGTPLIKKSVF